MHSNDFNIEAKPVETIPVSSLMEEAKKKLDAIPESELEKINSGARSIKTKFNASDWLNVLKGIGQQKALEAMGFENTGSVKSSAIYFVITVVIIIILIFLLK